MFADSFYESPWANHSRRGWTTLASFAAQAVVVGLLFLLPIVYTQRLPSIQLTSRELLLTPRAGMPAGPERPRAENTAASARPATGRLIAPRPVPCFSCVQQAGEVAEAPNTGPIFPVGDGFSRTINGVPWSTGGSLPVVQPPPHPPATREPVASTLMEGNLIRRVQPTYPILAKQTGVQGTVVLQAVISREGRIENLQAISGHPWLIPAAMDAVRQWRYRPYYLDGQPIEVETQVMVRFILSRD